MMPIEEAILVLLTWAQEHGVAMPNLQAQPPEPKPKLWKKAATLSKAERQKQIKEIVKRQLHGR